MDLKIIKTKRDYQVAIKRFEELFSARQGSKESDEADVLALLIENY
jgi:HTH-type transcriptional regulator/antitoxin HigA